MAPNELYSAYPVGLNVFRVLALTPSKKQDSKIICTLKLVHLDPETQRPEQTYEALSYLWGSKKDAKAEDILCDGKSVPVSKNCLEALVAIRQLKLATRLFVDAVCIDQGNKEERQQQITLMGDIYAGATRVISWLGPRDRGNNPGLDRVFQDMNRLHLLRPFLTDDGGLVKDTTAVKNFRNSLYSEKKLSITGEISFHSAKLATNSTITSIFESSDMM